MISIATSQPVGLISYFTLKQLEVFGCKIIGAFKYVNLSHAWLQSVADSISSI